MVYTGGAKTAESTIRKAGGRVVDVNDDLQIAKVSTTDRGFVAKARRAAGIKGVVRNHAVGVAKPGMPHRFAAERPSGVDKSVGARAGKATKGAKRSTEPLSDRQMGHGDDERRGGLQASHRQWCRCRHHRHRNRCHSPRSEAEIRSEAVAELHQDIPAIDGECEYPTCIDPANTDDGGHGTHVAGIVAADDNRFGIGGVAPDARLVNLRAGQDSGYFFLYETVAALVEAGNLRLDVVNMSFYTDPWLYNCESRADYVSGAVTDEEIAEQATVRRLVLNAVTDAYDRGVTLVASAGNGHTNYATPTRFDDTSPDYPPGSERERTVTDNCLDLPAEAPEVISLSGVGPSTTKADYSNYGFGDAEVSAPGGWFRDFIGTPAHRVPGNEILSSYPLDVAIEEGLADENGVPVDDFPSATATPAASAGSTPTCRAPRWPRPT